ncbi:SAM-dependent methyltransferase [Tistlia consotensis]|uniref:SAM-dependent methyltransferase n=1 Tax=Tistlia consotensis USBA 355 TaxID=560819 RepID=A0A1Y6B998_9PROT|nr:class I SAM-dependent rRNA methyltransferase [Tistlia consotensis]SME92341.1 SAM-dependent methyltransferase [Tistlia consotensis USBA 355]SNR27974.1 SAM-dependent methyltransferase [Tistlia consotensis]
MTSPKTGDLSLAERPTLRLKPKADKRVRGGHPWIFSNEIVMEGEARSLPPGTVARFETASGEPLGAFLYNRHPLIAARRLSRDPNLLLDGGWFRQVLRRALAIREGLVGVPFYRLVHAEADGLPGTVIDRFGDHLVLQVNVAGIEAHLDLLLEALDEVVSPTVILLRNDSAARQLEGIESYSRTAKGRLEGPVEIEERGARFLADLGEGQKTGWFYDQRDNRVFASAPLKAMGEGARVLDLYAFAGGFAVQAARAGAAEVLAIDRSASALRLAERSAQLNGVEGRIEFKKSDAFASLEFLERNGRRFDLVVADPPAFAKSRKDLPQALRAYRKLARLAAGVVVPGGYLTLCSCSHHVDPPAFAEQCRRGLFDAGREARLLKTAGAAPDHPVHPALPESAYLKALFYALD